MQTGCGGLPDLPQRAEVAKGSKLRKEALRSTRHSCGCVASRNHPAQHGVGWAGYFLKHTILNGSFQGIHSLAELACGVCNRRIVLQLVPIPGGENTIAIRPCSIIGCEPHENNMTSIGLRVRDDKTTMKRGCQTFQGCPELDHDTEKISSSWFNSMASCRRR